MASTRCVRRGRGRDHVAQPGQYIVALFAAWRLGATVTPISPTLMPAEAAYQIEDAAAKVVIVDMPVEIDAQVEMLSTNDLTAGQDPALRRTRRAPRRRARAADLHQRDHRPAEGRHARPRQPECHVRHGHRRVQDDKRGPQPAHPAAVSRQRDRGRHAVAAALRAAARPSRGGSARKRSSASSSRCGATYFSAVPTIYTMLSDLPAEVRPDTSSVRFAVCGAAPASVELLTKFETRYGIPLIEGYGLSEGTCASTGNPLDGERKPGTVGLPLPGQKFGSSTPDNVDVPRGETGEVLIAGPNVMRGYLNRPEETAKTLVDGWLHTGDIGRLDEDGYLVLVDRAKDMIIRGGENIYPKEIETVVYQLPEIAEAAVVGRAHPVYGEEPVLYRVAELGRRHLHRAHR